MKVVILGAGVVGTATAWYLADYGHDVTVIDRQSGPGLETSFANGGQISACHAEPWANPAVLPKLLKWLGRDDAPLVFRLNRWDPALWSWGLRFLANCTPSRAAVNTERTLRVALYSRSCLQMLRQHLGLDYHHQTSGILHIYNDTEDFAHARASARLMSKYGLVRQVRFPGECVKLEPTLAHTLPTLVGGIHTPDDESGDAHEFTEELATAAIKRGVTFQWGTTITGFDRQADKIIGLQTSAGKVTGDAFVMALGSYSPLLARQLGLKLPIIPAKGYSVTLTNVSPTDAPRMSVTDDSRKMVFTRLGDRLRVAGTAEMAGWDLSMTEVRWRALIARGKELFPLAGDWERAEPWAGLRAVTPDSVPLLGRTPISNLWLNTGHGTLGWTMACGAGRLVADLVSGKRTEIDTRGLGLDRF